MVTQRGAFILTSEYATPLKNRNHAIDEILQAARQGIGHQVKTICGAGFEPALDVIGYLIRRTNYHTMSAAARKRAYQFTHRITMLPPLRQRGVEKRVVAIAMARQG